MRLEEPALLDPRTTKFLLNVAMVMAFLIALVLIMTWLFIDPSKAFDTGKEKMWVYVPYIVLSLFIISVTYLILKLIKPLFELLVKYGIRSHANVKVGYQLFATVIWVIAILLMFYAISGNIENLGIGVTVMSAAVVFVLGQPVLNVFGWVLIIFRKPFVLGDRISINYGEYKVEGDVVDITLFYTFIRESGAWLKGEEHTGRMITVPNAVLLSTPMFNFTRADPRVWDRIMVVITFDSDHNKAKKILLRAAWKAMKKYKCADVDAFNDHFELRDLKTHILKGPEIEFEIEKNGVSLELLYLVHSRERGLVKSTITEFMLNDFSKNKKITFAYPHIAVMDGRAPAPKRRK